MTALSPIESTTLAECEAVIERGMSSFVEVGNALLTVSDQRLYRQTHGSFDEWVRDKYQMTARHAYRLCDAAEVVSECDPLGHTINERQARELAKAPKGERAEVLQKVKAKGKVTARAIKAEIAPAEEPPKTVDGEWLKAAGEPGKWKPELSPVQRIKADVDIIVSDALKNLTTATDLGELALHFDISARKLKSAQKSASC